MGSKMSHCNRGNDNFSSPSPRDSFDQSDIHISKKYRISTMHLNPDKPISMLSSSVSRILQYPEPTQHLRRVHAPCRKSKFFSSNSSRETQSDDNHYGLRSFLFRQYELSKTLAFDTFRYSRKDKVVSDLETEGSKDINSEDSSVEEVQNCISEDSRVVEFQSCISEDSSVEEIEILSDGQEIETNGKVTDYGRPAYSSSTVSDFSNQALNVDDVGKMLESMSVHNGVEDLGLPPHKRLLDSAEKRNSRLNDLAFEIDLNVKKLSLPSKHAKNSEKVLLMEPFSPLTEEEEARVSFAFSSSNWRKTLVTHQAFNIEITGEILQCLRPGGWLNDEVINLYLGLLKEREEREPNKFLKCHFFNTFFYRKLISWSNGYDFTAVRRWTTQRKIGYQLIDCDKIFVPIHKQTHWCLAVINRKDKKFQYLDSLKGMDTQVLQVVAKYYADEVKDKSALDIDVSSWEHEYVDDLPEQKNGSDCGMFMLKYTDFYSRGLRLYFGQKHMPYFRRRTTNEILKLKAE